MPPSFLRGRYHYGVGCLPSLHLRESGAVSGGCTHSTIVLLSRSYASRGGGDQDNSSSCSSSDKRLEGWRAAPVPVPSEVMQLAQRLQQSAWSDAGDTEVEDFTPAPSLGAGGWRRGGAERWSASSTAVPSHTRAASRGMLSMEAATTTASSSSPSLQPRKQRQQQQQQHRRPVAAASTAAAAVTVENSTMAADIVAEAFALSVGQNTTVDVGDDDIVLDTPASLLPCVSAAAAEELRAAHQRHQRCAASQQGGGRANDLDADAVTPEKYEFAHPAARGVGQDVIDLVTDVFTAQREAEVRRRREVLYELTHPNPADYTYNGKLVPPPPLSFGQITEEARSLGNKMMLGQTYSLVRQAGTRASEDDFCGTIYRGAGQPNASSIKVVAPSSTIETDISRPSSISLQQRRTAYRGRAREENIFRDHNYFFEVSQLYQEIVLVGKACAGKSSLLNSLLGQNVAKTSSSPNTTRKISFYQSVTPEQLHAFHAREHHNQLVKLPGGGLQLTFVDMPGYGIEGMSDKWRDAAIELTDAYFGVRRSVNTVLYCMDCERGLTKTDVKFFEWLENVQGTFFVVLTKCDSVPHSRITSVMRQVYTLITKHRRKYRKVFPFIIPTSAKDGTNVELLRGLITETSGMLPGDKLRDLLKQKKEVFTHTALLEEATRVDAARQLERAQAKEFFRLTRGCVALDDGDAAGRSERESTERAVTPSRDSTAVLHHGDDRKAAQPSTTLTAAPVPEGEAGLARASSSLQDEGGGRAPQRYVLGLGRNRSEADVAESLFLSGVGSGAVTSLDVFPTAASAEEAATQARRVRRERFLAWRRAHPLPTVRPFYGTSAKDNEGVQGMPLSTALQRDIAEGQTFSAAHDSSAGSRANTNATADRTLNTAHHDAEEEAGRRYRLHTGLDNPQAAHTVVDVPGVGEAMQAAGMTGSTGDTEGDTAAKPPVTAAPAPPIAYARSSVIGFTPGPLGGASLPSPASLSASYPSPRSPAIGASGDSAQKQQQQQQQRGPVSQFLHVLEAFSQQPNTVKSAKQRRKEARWQRKQKGRGGGGLLAEDANGRLSAYQAGKPCGPALVSLTTTVAERQAQWRAEQLKVLITKENPEAPWQAMQQLRRKLQARQEDAALAGMRKKEIAAYVRDAGRVTESFEKFEGEVTAAKYMNEVRQAPTLRSQQQMHLNATAKINYRSMPPGLWKRYGERDTYWPTPQVLGRAQDESHKP
jgi:small GTP-binding protein